MCLRVLIVTAAENPPDNSGPLSDLFMVVIDEVVDALDGLYNRLLE